MIALNDFKFLEVKPSALQHELITNKKNKSTVKFSSLAFFQLLVSSKSFDQICYLYKLKILLSRIILSDISIPKLRAHGGRNQIKPHYIY